MAAKIRDQQSPKIKAEKPRNQRPRWEVQSQAPPPILISADADLNAAAALGLPAEDPNAHP